MCKLRVPLSSQVDDTRPALRLYTRRTSVELNEMTDFLLIERWRDDDELSWKIGFRGGSAWQLGMRGYHHIPTSASAVAQESEQVVLELLGPIVEIEVINQHARDP
jgi:hypothetical protein